MGLDFICCFYNFIEFYRIKLVVAIIIDSMETFNEGKQAGDTSETEVNKRYVSEEDNKELRTIQR